MAVPIGGVVKAVLMLQVLLATFFHGVWRDNPANQVCAHYLNIAQYLVSAFYCHKVL